MKTLLSLALCTVLATAPAAAQTNVSQTNVFKPKPPESNVTLLEGALYLSLAAIGMTITIYVVTHDPNRIKGPVRVVLFSDQYDDHWVPRATNDIPAGVITNRWGPFILIEREPGHRYKVLPFPYPTTSL